MHMVILSITKAEGRTQSRTARSVSASSLVVCTSVCRLSSSIPMLPCRCAQGAASEGGLVYTCQAVASAWTHADTADRVFSSTGADPGVPLSTPGCIKLQLGCKGADQSTNLQRLKRLHGGHGAQVLHHLQDSGERQQPQQLAFDLQQLRLLRTCSWD